MDFLGGVLSYVGIVFDARFIGIGIVGVVIDAVITRSTVLGNRFPVGSLSVNRALFAANSKSKSNHRFGVWIQSPWRDGSLKVQEALNLG